jgi:hypothetical protein
MLAISTAITHQSQEPIERLIIRYRVSSSCKLRVGDSVYIL